MECTVLVNVSHVNENHLKFKPNKTWENNVKHGVHILKREPLNEKDGNAVAVLRPLSRNFTEAEHPNTVSKEDEIVGHIPLQMSQYVSKFLKRRTNNGKAIITGKRVNRGAGYGLEIPCSYIFYGDNDISIPWLKEKIESTGICHIE